MTEVRKLSNGRVRYIVNTHLHTDHVGGNAAIAKLIGDDPAQPLKIIAHENVLNRLTARVPGQPPFPEEGLPLDEYATAMKNLHFNGEAVVIYHEPNAHTDGDSLVLFRGSDVISAGSPARIPIGDHYLPYPGATPTYYGSNNFPQATNTTSMFASELTATALKLGFGSLMNRSGGRSIEMDFRSPCWP